MKDALTIHRTIKELVGVFQQAVLDVRAGLEALSRAEDRLNDAFTLDRFGLSLLSTLWRGCLAKFGSIVDRLELRRMISHPLVSLARWRTVVVQG